MPTCQIGDCGQEFETDKALHEHIIEEHKGICNIRKVGEEYRVVDEMECHVDEECNFTAKTDYIMLKHIQRKHGLRKPRKEGHKWVK